MTKVLGEMARAMNEFQADPDRDMFVNELRIVVNRQKGLSLVLGSDPDALQKYIDSFSIATPTKADERLTSSSRDLQLASRSGPCNNYQSLKLFASFERENFGGMTSPDDVGNKRRDLDAIRVVFLLLCKSCKTSLNDLFGARSALKAEREKKRKQEADDARKQAEQQKAASKRRSTTGPAIFDFEPSQGRTNFSIAVSKSGRDVDLKLPGIIAVTLPQSLLDPIKKDISDFRTDFDNSDLKVTQGRAQARLGSDEVVSNLRRFTKDLFKPDAIVHPSDIDKIVGDKNYDKLFEYAAPFVFGTVINHVAARPEAGALPTVRYQWQGTKVVAVCRLSSLVKFLMSHAKSVVQSCTVTSATCSAWLRSARGPQLQQFIDGGDKILWGTIGVGDVLYLPAGWLCAERTAGAEDCLGVKLSFMTAPSVDIAARGELELYKREFNTAGKKDTLAHQSLALYNYLVAVSGPPDAAEPPTSTPSVDGSDSAANQGEVVEPHETIADKADNSAAEASVADPSSADKASAADASAADASAADAGARADDNKASTETWGAT